MNNFECDGNCENCPYYDPSPIVSGNYSGYCEYYNDAIDNVLGDF